MISPNGFWLRNVEGILRELTFLIQWATVWKVKSSKAGPVIRPRRKSTYREPDEPG